jgi:simple sugar transport system ATP-binding protein
MLAVAMRNITKRFGALRANDNVTFSAERGEIHALVGENGAGKSTLMKVLYGIEQPDGGEIFIHGVLESLHTPAKAIKLGIGMVHQHFMLIPTLTVAENIILGNEPVTRVGSLDLPGAERSIRQLSDAYHFNIDPHELVGSLSVGEQQRVEILKLLYRKAEIIILDEPTAILTPQEVEGFFQILRTFKQENKTVIFISHKVGEIMTISDRVTVMRKGRVVGSVRTVETTANELARMMVGREIGSPSEKTDLRNRNPLLTIKELSCEGSRQQSALRNVSLEVDSGEILGIAAVEGNGQTELIEVLTGLRKAHSGSIVIEGAPALAHVPEDRLKHGLILDFTLEENFILGRQREQIFGSRFGLSWVRIHQYSVEQIERFDIDARSALSKAKELSGGNQQKVVVARELSKNAKVIIACHPTRGLDVGATEFVHNALLQERNNGRAVLLASSDLTELLALSDRIAVMYSGSIAAVLNAHETSERELGLYMTGALPVGVN